MLSTHRWMLGSAMTTLLLSGLLAGCRGRPESEGGAGTLGDIVARMPSSFEATVTITPTEGEPRTSAVALQMSGGKPLRMKAEALDDRGTIVVDYQQKRMFLWDAARRAGVVMPLTDEQANLPEDPYGDIDPETAIGGSEVVEGVDCWVVETTDDQGRAVTSWYAKDNGLVQSVVTEDMTMTYEYSRVGEVPDSEFKVPTEITFQEMSTMPAPPSGG